MNNFTIKDIERLSGIKAHTLRIWEQRHGLCFCKRKESKHRYYDNEDLKEILRIAFLYHNGYKVSKIATLSKDQIKLLSVTATLEGNFDIYINQMIESSIDFDQARFEKIIHHAFLQLGFEKSVAKVLYPFMHKIGLLWITQHVIPAQEHFSSHLILKKILLAIDGLEEAVIKKDAVVLVYSPEKELHEIPLLVIQYILKKNGVSTVYFGPGIPVSELAYYCTHKPVTHIWFHFITNFLHQDPQEYLNNLVNLFPEKKIIASGPAMLGVKLTSPQTTLITSLEEFFLFHQNL
ncbi:MAG: MerR family transcriptional regulator [Chitinophagaceae bacterium]